MHVAAGQCAPYLPSSLQHQPSQLASGTSLARRRMWISKQRRGRARERVCGECGVHRPRGDIKNGFTRGGGAVSRARRWTVSMKHSLAHGSSLCQRADCGATRNCCTYSRGCKERAAWARDRAGVRGLRLTRFLSAKSHAFVGSGSPWPTTLGPCTSLVRRARDCDVSRVVTRFTRRVASRPPVSIRPCGHRSGRHWHACCVAEARCSSPTSYQRNSGELRASERMSWFGSCHFCRA